MVNADRKSIQIKILVMLQVICLIIQLSVRAHDGLPSAQLEVLALAYVLLWGKPQEIITATEVDARRFATADEMSHLLKLAPRYLSCIRFSPCVPTSAIHPLDNVRVHPGTMGFYLA